MSDDTETIRETLRQIYPEHERESPSWYEYHENVYTLCRYLVCDRSFDAKELLPVIEKPWKWHDEFIDAMVERSKEA